MPQPHFPIRGGSQMPKANSVPAQSDSGADCANCQALHLEVARLRQQLGRSHESGGFAGAGSSIHMVWAALGLCGAGLLFALLALVHHG